MTTKELIELRAGDIICDGGFGYKYQVMTSKGQKFAVRILDEISKGHFHLLDKPNKKK